MNVPSTAAGTRLDKFLAEALGSRGAAERAVAAGALVDGVARPNEVEQVVGGDVGRHERQHRCRQDPARAPDVEVAEAHPPVAARLRDQEPGDQEAGEDEEDVYADVTAPEERKPRVAEHHEQYRDRA